MRLRQIINFFRNNPMDVWEAFGKDNQIIGVEYFNKNSPPTIFFKGYKHHISIGLCKLSHNLKFHVTGTGNRVDIADGVVNREALFI